MFQPLFHQKDGFQLLVEKSFNRNRSQGRAKKLNFRVLHSLDPGAKKLELVGNLGAKLIIRTEENYFTLFIVQGQADFFDFSHDEAKIADDNLPVVAFSDVVSVGNFQSGLQSDNKSVDGQTEKENRKRQ